MARKPKTAPKNAQAAASKPKVSKAKAASTASPKKAAAKPKASAAKLKKTKAKPAAKARKRAKPAKNGSAASNQQIDSAVLEKVSQLRAQVRESFGKIVMAMMMLPRYRHQSIADLQHLVLEPLIRDRIAVAYPGGAEGAPGNDPMRDVAGLSIWASVSDEVDARIREQISAGTFPIRLGAEDWTSGDNNWLLDVIAPDAKTTTSVIANFRQVVKEGSLKLHPLVTRLVDPDVLAKMGAEKMGSK